VASKSYLNFGAHKVILTEFTVVQVSLVQTAQTVECSREIALL
jgi:hypothetical protein